MDKNKRPKLYALKISYKYDANMHHRNYKLCNIMHKNFQNIHYNTICIENMYQIYKHRFLTV